MAKILKEFIRPKAFDILRTKYQLGYSAKCELDTFGGVMGLSVYVISQEHKHKFTEVQEKITEFMQTTITIAIDELTDDEFEKLKNARMKHLQVEVLSLAEETSHNWDEITDEHYRFNRNEIYIEVTKRITKDEFQQFYHTFFDVESQRVLCIQVIGRKDENTSETNDNNELMVEFMSEKFTDHDVITDIEEFQKDLELFPVLKVID